MDSFWRSSLFSLSLPSPTLRSLLLSAALTSACEPRPLASALLCRQGVRHRASSTRLSLPPQRGRGESAVSLVLLLDRIFLHAISNSHFLLFHPTSCVCKHCISPVISAQAAQAQGRGELAGAMRAGRPAASPVAGVECKRDRMNCNRCTFCARVYVCDHNGERAGAGQSAGELELAPGRGPRAPPVSASLQPPPPCRARRVVTAKPARRPGSSARC